MLPTKKQLEIADKLLILVSENETFRTLKAKIEDEVSESVDAYKRNPPTESQLAYAESLGIIVKNDSLRILSAKISDELEKRNISSLKELKIKEGDVVKLKGACEEESLIVSTIKNNGKIYFKGNGCNQAWASQIEKVIKRS